MLIKDSTKCQSELCNTTNSTYKGPQLQQKKQVLSVIDNISSKNDVNENIKTHTDERSCQCSVCDKLFDNDSHVISHMRVKCGKIKPVFILLKKLYIRSMNPVEDNSVLPEINADDIVDALTVKDVGHTTSHTSNIPNVNSSENTDSIRSNQKTSANDITLDMDMDYVLVKSEVNIDPIDSQVNMDDDNILFKSEIFHKRVDDITGMVKGHNGKISEVNVNSCENTDFIEAINENLVEDGDNNYKLVESKDIKSECSASNKSFTYMKTRTELNPFACTVCSKSFTQSEHFRRHMRIHTGKKPFSCSLCEKSFTMNHTLKTHMRTHTGEKPFQCTVCCKPFSHNISLKTHMRKHNKETQFEYSVCKNEYFNKDNLNEGRKALSDKNLYKCSVCDKLFDDNSHMKSHMKAKCGKIKPVCVVLKKLFIRLMNPLEDNSVNSEIDTDDRADGNVEGHTTNIPEINVNSYEDTNSVKANHENSAESITVDVDNGYIQVKCEAIVNPLDSVVDMDNDNMLFKSETILNPIYEEVKTEAFVDDVVDIKTEIEDYDEEDIIDIVDHGID